MHLASCCQCQLAFEANRHFNVCVGVSGHQCSVSTLAVSNGSLFPPSTWRVACQTASTDPILEWRRVFAILGNAKEP